MVHPHAQRGPELGGDQPRPHARRPQDAREDALVPPAVAGRILGPITREAYGPEWYATIFAFAESPKQAGVLWAGSDDGYVQVSRDNGESWTKVTPPDLPEFALISIIDPSPHDAGDRLRRRHALQAAGQQALPVQDVGLRHDVDEDRGRHSRPRLHARHPRGSRPQGAVVCRDRDRRLRLVRRRRALAAAQAQPAGGAGARPDGEERRPRRRDARPVVLDPRQRGAAAAS